MMLPARLSRRRNAYFGLPTLHFLILFRVDIDRVSDQLSLDWMRGRFAAVSVGHYLPDNIASV